MPGRSFYISPMITKIPIEIIEIEPDNYHAFVKVRIGRRNARFLLDTGASKTVLDNEKILKFVKADAVMAYDDAKSVGLGTDTVETHIARLRSIRIGDLQTAAVDVAVLSLSHVNVVYSMLKLHEIDGVLGSDLLVRFHAVISYRARTLSLKK